jgi:aspartyl/asparaginyl beta-hydroxylase (cupin superfamily)
MNSFNSNSDLREKTLLKNNQSLTSSTTEALTDKDKPFKRDNIIFYPINDYSQLKMFNANFKDLQTELIKLIINDENRSNDQKIFQPWIEHDLYYQSNPTGWDIAPFMINKCLIEKNCILAPYLYEIIKTIPFLVSVSYSLLKPNTHIIPHKGYDEYSEKILRYHMGMIIPNGDLGIRVANEMKIWKEGESFIFDDYQIHEAWNFTNDNRYVLICDFIEPESEIGKISDENFNKSIGFYMK